MLVVCAFVGIPASSSSQATVPLRVEENFRREPQGLVLGRIRAGTRVVEVSRNGNWVEVDLEGWVWLASLRARSEGAFDLAVSATGGENLREAPGGRVIGQLDTGTLLEEREREPGWARVRRRGWLWSASLGTAAAAPPVRAAPPRVSEGGVQARDYASVGAHGGALLTAPDGDTLGTASPGTDLQLLGREGGWARVRLEGWMWMPAANAGSDLDSERPVELTPEALRREGDVHAGRVVAWIVQFISLERAEVVRTDFYEGEPFLLTRHGSQDGPFIYVAVPPERLAEVQGLVPLESIRVTARVRKAASALTGTPILDLLGWERLPW